MHAPSSRTRRLAGLSAGPVAVLLAGLLVWQGSNAAFSSSTRNPGNSWTSGSVALTDDDKGSAGFTVDDLVPGDTGSKCIKVTAASDVPGVVRGYVANLNKSAQGLEKYIKLDVEQGTGGDFNDCAGFVADADPTGNGFQSLETLSSVNTDFASGGTPWAITGEGASESRVYKGTWKFDVSGLSQSQVDALQSASTSIDLVWELQNDEAAE